MSALKLDEIGYWSEIKLEIVRQYAQAYSIILNKQKSVKRYLYIDGFAGAGSHISKSTGDTILGSPAIALRIKPEFNEYHFIDLEGDKANELRKLAEDNPDVHVYEADCNDVLLKEIFPRARFEDYRRALCLLDPYGLHLDWKVIHTAGHMHSVEIFLNFPMMDMNMNVLWHKPGNVNECQAQRMDRFWGDRSWREVAYRQVPDLFDTIEEKEGNEIIADAFRKRLQKVAGFEYVPEPIPMRNSKGAVIYYLFFASPNKTGEKIVRTIFGKYRDKGL